MTSIILKTKREKSLLRRHPWIFSGAVKQIEGHPAPGETVDILSPDRTLLGQGAYSPSSQMIVRVWTFDPDEPVNASFFRSRLEKVIQTRRFLYRNCDWKHLGCRLVNSESDGLPGLIVDRYADFLVCQFLTTGAEFWKDTLTELLNELVPNQGIYERSDANERKKEGLDTRTGLILGQEPPDLVEIHEAGYRFFVDIRNGHKTGFYLDQRVNRGVVAGFAKGMDVLNCFAYTGGFAVAALKAGAVRVVNVDSSADALAIARRNMELNGLNPELAQNEEGNVFKVLRTYREQNRQFDMIILDPPKFADSRSSLMRAARGYKDINLLAFRLLKPGGLLITFSCSGLVSRELFQKIVSDAALDEKKDAQILQRLSQAPDHPIGLNFPEADYLKGLICRIW
ncbi:MAG: class I SAM-dependent methyltransferase [Desulfobacterales bacterium]|nr:class I SAM-dependent methyltransferase [Desulfobacterales bacterium]MDD4072094.1 class I SAM-dependent methyltransferase [Desulfobacterales bacterium]MDD4393481.1 class I SAM-dependent methyltransferase [Desulfobacterales bacterium]